MNLKPPYEMALMTSSPEMMQDIAARLVSILGRGAVLGMIGPLGAGKTTFVQGAVKGLSSNKTFRVKSPTYALWHSYPTTPVLHHLDLYRLSGEEEIYAMGIEDALNDSDAIVCVEWADRCPGLFGPNTFWLSFPMNADSQRKLLLRAPLGLEKTIWIALTDALSAYKC